MALDKGGGQRDYASANRKKRSPKPKPSYRSPKPAPSRRSKSPRAVLGGYDWKDLGGPSAHQARPMGNWQSDNAVDLAAPAGTPIYAVRGGLIVGGFGESNNGSKVYGSRMTIQDSQGVGYFYTHMGGYAPGIKPGARVRRGQIIGYVGQGAGIPSHLHFATSHGDPYDYLRGTRQGKKPKLYKVPAASPPPSTSPSGSYTAPTNSSGRIDFQSIDYESAFSPPPDSTVEFSPYQFSEFDPQDTLVDPAITNRASLWTSLAQLPGASPETQTYARMFSGLETEPAPNPNSLKELERQALAS